MKTKHLLLLAALMLPLLGVSAQDINSENTRPSYTRGQGFVIRPELYSGLFAELGYQINPFVMVSGGIGFDLGGNSGTCLMVGVRAYTSERRWSGMFDYHVGSFSLQGYNLIRHTMVGGFSYKDFDMGAGAMYLTDTYDGALGLTITLGWNIRTYPHR